MRPIKPPVPGDPPATTESSDVASGSAIVSDREATSILCDALYEAVDRFGREDALTSAIAVVVSCAIHSGQERVYAEVFRGNTELLIRLSQSNDHSGI